MRIRWNYICEIYTGAWWATVHGVTKSWTWLSDWTELSVLNEMEIQKREDVCICMADSFCCTPEANTSTRRVRHNLVSEQQQQTLTKSSLVAQMVKCLQYGRPRFDPWVGRISWRRKWQPTPVFLPRESQGRRSLVGYSPWDRTESDTTEVT